MKVNFVPGSKQSIELLRALDLIDKTSVVFESKFIRTLLDYKVHKIAWLAYSQFVIYIAYLSSIISYPNEILAMVWAILFIIEEAIQCLAGDNLSVTQYFESLDNFMDLARIVLLLVYSTKGFKGEDPDYEHKCWETQQIIFGWLVLVSGLGVFKHIQISKTFRIFMIMMYQSLVKVSSFLVVLVIILMSFTGAFYFV